MEGGKLAPLDELRNTPGIVAAWLAESSGRLLGGAVPPGAGSGPLASVGAAMRRMLSAAKGDVLELAFQGGRLRADAVEEDWVLLVLAAPGADLAWVRMSCEVARARLREVRRTAARGA